MGNSRPKRRRPVCAVSIAASDSSGGAGIQADLLTFAAHGVYGATVLAGATAQDTRRVRAVETLSPAFLEKQIDAVFEDLSPRAVKIGLLFDAPRIRAVARSLSRGRASRVVLDPVTESSSGTRFLGADALKAVTRELLPLSSLVTPNVPEAEALSGVRIRSDRDRRRAAQVLVERGAAAVLVKAGHLRGELLRDLLFDGRTFLEFAHRRLPTRATHGTGCTLSSAIAANLALGRDLPDAIDRAIRYLTAGLRRGLFPGRGLGVPDHFPRAVRGDYAR